MVFKFNSFMIELFIDNHNRRTKWLVNRDNLIYIVDRHISQGFIIFMVVHYSRHYNFYPAGGIYP